MANPASTRTRNLTSVDTTWLRMEDPTNLMMITGVLVFSEPLDLDRLRATMTDRLLRYGRFRQKVEESAIPFGRPRWRFDRTFDLDAHITRMALPSPGDRQALQEVVSHLMSTPLDVTKPLWHFHVIEGFDGGTALVIRLHHCIADGIALVMVMLSMADNAEVALPVPRPYRRQSRTPTEKLMRPMVVPMARAARQARRMTENVLHEGVETVLNPSRAFNMAELATNAASALARLLRLDPDPPTAFKGSLGIRKLAVWTPRHPLAEVKASGRRIGATINDILMAVVTGALRGYLLERGHVPEDLSIRAVIPVNLRPPEEMHELGNRFGLVFLSLPVGISDPIDRQAVVQERMRELKGSAEPVVAFGALAIAGTTTTEIQNAAVQLFGSKATAVMTNVPGPRHPLELAGQRISDVMFWVPQSARLGLGISILSYAGFVRVGFAVDARLVPDPERMVEAFEREYADCFEMIAEMPEERG